MILLECLHHRLLHNRLHLIRYIFSGFDYYLIVLGMNNAGIKTVQFSGNTDQRQFETHLRLSLEPED